MRLTLSICISPANILEVIQAFFELKSSSAHTSPVSAEPSSSPTNAEHRAQGIALSLSMFTASAQTETPPYVALRPLSPGVAKRHDLPSDSDSESDTEYSDTESDSDSGSDVETSSDEGDPWTTAVRMQATASATPRNTPILPTNTTPTSLDDGTADLLLDKLLQCAQKHVICWTCGVVITHDPSCRRKHVPSKVRVPLQPAREMSFPKPLPTIRECEVDFPEYATLQSVRPTALVSQSESMKMLTRIAANDTRARNQLSLATQAMRILSIPVGRAITIRKYLGWGADVRLGAEA